MKVLLTVLVIFYLALKQTCDAGVTIKDCETDTKLPSEVTLGNCATEELCIVKKAGPMEIEMTFNSPRFLENISPKLMGITALGNISFTINEEQQNACTGLLNTLCPLVAEEIVEYKFDVTFTALPMVPVNLQFELVDEDTDETVVCFRSYVYPKEDVLK